MKSLRFILPGAGLLGIGLIIAAHALQLHNPKPSSNPSNCLAGVWRNVDHGNLIYYSPIDPSLRTGTFRFCNEPSYGFGPAFRFKVIHEEPSSRTLVIREFRDFTAINAIYGLSLSNRSDIICSISENVHQMTQEYNYEGQNVFSVYERVESEIVP